MSSPNQYQHVGVGARIWFADERKPYAVRAVSADGRWAVCTKPFAALKTVLYTVVDFEEQLRGTDNYVGCLGYETDDECAEALALFECGEAEFSRRRPPITLQVSRIENPGDAGVQR